jgi:peptide methionine sulfoxide reductase MsrB
MSNLLAVDRTDKIVKSDAARRAQLTPERYRIVPQHGTERAYCINGAALAFKPGDP